MVTGSTGFKGAWLSYWLFKIGSKVVGVGLKPEKDSIIFKSLNLNKKIKQYYVDIRSYNKLDSIVKKEKPDIIFHLAAQSIVSSSFINPLETFSTNILGSTHILEVVRKNKVPNLVFITSDKCYLNNNKSGSYKESDILGGLDNYSSSKASAEIVFASYYHSYFKGKFLKVASARAGNVIGGGDFKKDRIIPDVIKALHLGKSINLRNPNATRPWQHVLEPLSGYLILGHKLLNKKIKSNIIPNWNFGPYQKNCKTVNFIVKMIIEEWAAGKKNINIKKNKNFYESKLLSLNISKAKKELSWEPRLTLIETIKFTVDWYKHYLINNRAEDISTFQIEYFTEK